MINACSTGKIKVKIKVSNDLADIFVFYTGKLLDFLISEFICIKSMGNILSL